VSWTPSLAKASTFRKRYRVVLEGLYGSIPAGAGLSEKEISLSERKLGFKLPAALRQFYLLSGKFKRLIKAHNRFYSPAKFSRDGNKIIFLEENQGAFFWALDAKRLEEADPPVLQGVESADAEAIHWHPECDRCSDFLVGMICWQAANGGLPYGGWAAAPKAVERQLREFMTLVWEVPKFLICGENGAVVCLAKHRGYKHIQAAAKTRADLERVRQTFNLTWTISMP
jgi:hypothetical protein